jgi:hypothetical protein
MTVRKETSMKRRLLPGAALALTASLAIAATAPAASWIDPGEPTYVPTPAGKLDHYVYEYENVIDGATRTSRMETWVSADRSHTLFTSGGTLLTEEATEGSEWRVFYADANEIKVRPLKTPGRPVMHTLRSQAAIVREQLDRDYLRVEGETRYEGRRALVLTDGPVDPDRHHNTERLVVDPESYVVLEGRLEATGYDENGGNPIRTTSVRRLVLDETVALAGNEAKLRFGDHPGARIVQAAGLEEFSARDRAKRAKARAKARRAKAQRAKARRAKARRRAARRA